MVSFAFVDIYVQLDVFYYYDVLSFTKALKLYYTYSSQTSSKETGKEPINFKKEF